MDESYSTDQLAKELGFDIEAKLTHWQFSVNTFLSYLNKIEENNFAVSYSYLYRVASTVTARYPYSPDKILSEIGADIYQNGGNPLFRILCGDTLVTSYDVGALLVASVTIEFSSHEHKIPSKVRLVSILGPLRMLL